MLLLPRLKLHKYILLLASLVATVTYAAGFSPPGDVWQDTAANHLAGDPIIRDTHHKRYVAFFYCNATAFAVSLVVIVITLTLAYLDDNKVKYSRSRIVIQYVNRRGIAVLTLQAVMVLDLLSLMGAYAAGTCRDTFTTVYSLVLVGFVFIYLVAQVAVAHWPQASPTRALAAYLKASENPNSGSSGVSKPEAVEEGEQQMPKQAGYLKVWVVGKFGVMHNNVRHDKAEDRFRKVLMLLATFAVNITYVAGLSTPGGFWDSAGTGHRPDDAILKDRHNRRLAVFFGFNTMAFGTSLLIIVVLLDTKLRPKNRLRPHRRRAPEPHRRVQRRQLQADRHHLLRRRPHPCRCGLHFVCLLDRRPHPRHMGSNIFRFQENMRSNDKCFQEEEKC